MSAFKHAGFTDPFTEHVLDLDDAWIGAPPSTVIDTTPKADDTTPATSPTSTWLDRRGA